MKEREFQDQVIAMAILYGWKVHHVRPGMTRNGAWMTHVQGHTGFPDLVMAYETELAKWRAAAYYLAGYMAASGRRQYPLPEKDAHEWIEEAFGHSQ